MPLNRVRWGHGTMEMLLSLLLLLIYLSVCVTVFLLVHTQTRIRLIKPYLKKILTLFDFCTYIYEKKSQNRCDSCTYIYVQLYTDFAIEIWGFYRHLIDNLRYHHTSYSHASGLLASISQHVYQVGRKVEFTRS